MDKIKKILIVMIIMIIVIVTSIVILVKKLNSVEEEDTPEKLEFENKDTYKVEQKIFFRSPDVIIFNLLMPLVVFILISMISGSKEAGTLTFSQSSYIALSTVGICCSAFMSIPISIVESRSHGILRRLYCSPCSPARLLACDTIASAIMAVISTLILTFTAVIFFGYRMSGNVIIYILLWILTMLSMFSIGLMIASLCRT